jgi:hypothetical protein
MRILVGILSFILLFAILWDAFETLVLPRHVRRAFRLARLFFRSAWILWSSVVSKIRNSKLREAYLSYFGPVCLLMLFAFWASGLVLAFAIMQWAGGSALYNAGIPSNFRIDLYFSGTTFFTLGMGDVLPRSSLARILAVAEAGTGFGFLAIAISYLPTLYGAFSQREIEISLLDARAGSPPTAAELLRRHGRQRISDGLADYLRAWESWSAQLMETHLTYPVLCFFRSQHDNQSWLAAFTAILDSCALLIAYGEGETKWQAQLTFAISRHAVSDLTQVLQIKPRLPELNRLPSEDLPKVRNLLAHYAVPECTAAEDAKLAELRGMYEPHLHALSTLLLMPLPSWGLHIARKGPTVWDRITSDEVVATEPDRSELDHL